MTSAMGVVNEYIDRLSAQYDKYYDKIQGYTAFKLAESTAEKVDSASGFKNIVAKPLDVIGKIGRYLHPQPNPQTTPPTPAYEFINYSFFPLRTLVRLSKPAKELIGFTECFTKVISILKDIRFYQPRKYVIVSQSKDDTSSNIAYYHQNRFDRAAAISTAVADWLVSCADWADFLRSPTQTYLEPVGRWSGRVLTYTSLWNEGRFLYTAYMQRHRNKENTKEVQGTIAKQEFIGSFLKLAFAASFVVLDIFTNTRFRNDRVVFWIGCTLGVAQPIVYHYFPNFVTKPLQREVEEKAIKA